MENEMETWCRVFNPKDPISPKQVPWIDFTAQSRYDL